MKKIYKDAQNKYVACSMLYVNDGKVYNDQAYNDQTYTSSLREAFKQNDVVVNADEDLYKVIEYDENNGVGIAKYIGIGEVAGKNKYPVTVNNESNNITGDFNSKWPQGNTLAMALVPKTSQYEEFIIDFTSDSYVSRVLKSFGSEEELTLSFYAKTISGNSTCDIKLMSGSSVSDAVSVQSSKESRVSITTTASDLKMSITQTGGAYGSLMVIISKLQIEEGNTATEYEPYTTTEQVTIFSAASKPDN